MEDLWVEIVNTWAGMWILYPRLKRVEWPTDELDIVAHKAKDDLNRAIHSLKALEDTVYRYMEEE